ncbi:MAG: HAD-IA family hydrolase [Myxococcota bacterium]|nr:HAD-IA family hydrolase [Myxococcota bacterium]
MKLAAVLFDVTGTLIELAEGVGVTYARIAARHGVSVSAERVQTAFGHAMRKATPCVFPGLEAGGIPGAERDWWRDRVRETFEAGDEGTIFPDFEAFFREVFDFYAGAEAWRLRAGIPETLRAARRAGLRMGVISNFDHRLPEVLQALDIQKFMEIMAFPARFGFAKPHPALFEAALAELRLSPGQCAYVGHDPVLDLAPARAAGLRTLEVDPGPGSRPLSARIEGIAKLPS